MELLEVVRRRVGAAVEAAVGHVAVAHEGRAAEDGQEEGVGFVEDEADSRLVDLFDPALLAVDGERGVRHRHQIGVQVDVLVPEDEVVGGEGGAVGPFVALTELDGEDPVAVAELPALGQGGSELGAGVVPEDELVAGDVAVAVLVVAGAGEAAAQRARRTVPIPSSGCTTSGSSGDALLDRGQRAVLHQRVQHRGLLEGLRARRVDQDDGAFELADERAAERLILRGDGERGARGTVAGGRTKPAAAAPFIRPRRETRCSTTPRVRCRKTRSSG